MENNGNFETPIDISEIAKTEKSDIVHGLIQEFRHLLNKEDLKFTLNTDAIVVLSGESRSNQDVMDDSQENFARIKFAIEVIKQIVAQKSGRMASADNIIKLGPELFLNGEDEQLPAMEATALSLGFPKDKIGLINCVNNVWLQKS